MRTAAPKNKEPVQTPHYCGECVHGQWIEEHWNLDNENQKPICLRCPFRKYPVIRTERACERFRGIADGPKGESI